MSSISCRLNYFKSKTNFFISDSSAGDLMDSPPTDSDSVLQMVGIGMNTDEIFVNILDGLKPYPL